MKLVKLISTSLDSTSRLLSKFLGMGQKDVQENHNVSPWGVDSNPVADYIALYAETTVSGEAVIVGYILKDRIADVGETRIYSTNTGGKLETYIHLKNDGTIEFMGDVDNLIRYAKTAASINELKNDINDLKTILSTWVPVPNDGGAALKAALGTYFATPIIEDITGAKIDEFKTL